MIRSLTMILGRVRVWLDREVTGRVKHVLGISAFLVFAFSAVIYQIQTLDESSRQGDLRSAVEAREAVHRAAYHSCVEAAEGRNDLWLVLRMIVLSADSGSATTGPILSVIDERVSSRGESCDALGVAP